MEDINVLVQSNQNIIKDVLDEFPTAINDENYLDYVQEGNKALVLAINTFDFKKNYDFSSYAFQIVECEIISYIMGYSSVISISEEMLEQSKIFNLKKEALEKLENKSLSVVELVNKTGYPIEKVVMFLKYNLFSLRFKYIHEEEKDNAIEDIMLSTKM